MCCEVKAKPDTTKRYAPTYSREQHAGMYTVVRVINVPNQKETDLIPVVIILKDDPDAVEEFRLIVRPKHGIPKIEKGMWLYLTVTTFGEWKVCEVR